MEWTVIIAQAVPVPVTVQQEPLGGWGNLLLQGSAFALLTWILTVFGPKVLTVWQSERQKDREALKDREDKDRETDLTREAMQRTERETERKSRHDLGERYTGSVSDCMDLMVKEGRIDRAAFAVRTDKIEGKVVRVEERLTKVEQSLLTVCRYDPDGKQDGKRGGA